MEISPDLKKRLITAGALVAVTIILLVAQAVYAPAKAVLMLVASIITLLAAAEFGNMCASEETGKVRSYLYFLFALLPTIIALFAAYIICPCAKNLQTVLFYSIVLGVFVSFIFSVLYMVSISQHTIESARRVAEELFIGVILIGFCGGALVILTMWEDSYRPLFWLLLVVCLNDTAAYFIGKKFGETKIAPTISPNKTVVGSIAGLATGLVVGACCGKIFLQNGDLISYSVLSIFTVVAAQTGDLSKSYLKRIHQQKDSGNLLPGHGGVLDRIDGVLAASPVIYFWLTITS